MKHPVRAALAALCLCSGAALAEVEVAGVRFADQLTVAGQPAQLNGAGLRTRFAFKVYAMGLYLPQPRSQPQAVFEDAGAKRIRLVLLRDLKAESLVDALMDGLKNNHDAQQLAALQTPMAELRSAMLSLGEARKGTVVELDALPNGHTRLSIDGQPHGADIVGAGFYPALLRIWLGERPADADLKQALLGSAS